MKFKDKTRGGYDKRIYATDAGGDYPIHGAIQIKGKWGVAAWTVEGRRSGYMDQAYDLLPLREPSEAAVEAARLSIKAGQSVGSDAIREALRAAYEIDGIGGGE